MTTHSVVSAATHIIPRRAETTSAGREVRTPTSAATLAYSAVASATNSAAVPTAVIGSDRAGRLGLELRGALRDQRVLRADEAPAGHVAGDDDLAPVAERVRHRAAVDDRDGRAAAAAVAHLEAQEIGVAVHAAGLDLAGQLVAAAGGRGGEQLRGRHGVARGGERGVGEGRGEHQGGGQSDDQPDAAAA